MGPKLKHYGNNILDLVVISNFLRPLRFSEGLNSDQLAAIEKVFSEGSPGTFVSVDLTSNETFYHEMTRSVTALASKCSKKVTFVSRSNILTMNRSNIEKDTYVIGYDLESLDQDVNEKTHRLILDLFASQGKFILFGSSLDNFVERITFFHSGDRLKITSRLHDIFGIESRQIKHPLNRYIDRLPDISQEDIDLLLEKLNILLKSFPKDISASLKPILEDKFDHVRMTEDYLIEVSSGNPSQDLQRLYLDFSFFKNNPWLPLENIFCQLGNFQCDTNAHKELWLDIQEIDPSSAVGTYLIGQNGIGKTHLAVGKGKELMEKGFEVHFIQPQHAESLLKKFQDSDRIMTSNSMTVWILDDFNALADCNKIQQKYFLDVIDLILKRGGIVIATSNLPLDDLMSNLTRNLPEEERLNILTKIGEIFGLQFYLNDNRSIFLKSKKRSPPSSLVFNPDTAIIPYENNPFRSIKLTSKKLAKGDQEVYLRLVEPGTTFALIEKIEWNSEEVSSQLTHVVQTAYFEALNSSGQTIMIEQLQLFWRKVAIKLNKVIYIPGLDKLIQLIMNESMSVQLSRYKPKDLLSLSEEELDDILFARSLQAQKFIRSFLPNRVLILTKYLDAYLTIEIIIQNDHDSEKMKLHPFMKSSSHSTFILKLPIGMKDKPETAESILKLLENHFGKRNELSEYGEMSLKWLNYGAYISEIGKLARENEQKLTFLDRESTLSALKSGLSAASFSKILNFEKSFADLEKIRESFLHFVRIENHGYLAHHQTFGKMLYSEIRDWVELEVTHDEIVQILSGLFSNDVKLKEKIPTWIKTVDAHAMHSNSSNGFSGPSPGWIPSISHIEYSALFSDPKKQDNIPVRSYNLPHTSLLFYQQFFIEGNIKPMYRMNAARLIWTAQLFEKPKQILAFHLDWLRFSEEIASIVHGKEFKGNHPLIKQQIWRKIHPDPEEMGLYPEDCSEWISPETGFKGYSVPDSKNVFIKFSDWQKYMNNFLLSFSD